MLEPVLGASASGVCGLTMLQPHLVCSPTPPQTPQEKYAFHLQVWEYITSSSPPPHPGWRNFHSDLRSVLSIGKRTCCQPEGVRDALTCRGWEWAPCTPLSNITEQRAALGPWYQDPAPWGFSTSLSSPAQGALLVSPSSAHPCSHHTRLLSGSL